MRSIFITLLVAISLMVFSCGKSQQAGGETQPKKETTVQGGQEHPEGQPVQKGEEHPQGQPMQGGGDTTKAGAQTGQQQQSE